MRVIGGIMVLCTEGEGAMPSPSCSVKEADAVAIRIERVDPGSEAEALAVCCGWMTVWKGWTS